MLGSILVMGSLLMGQTVPEDAALQMEVRRLVRQLDAPQLAKREAAETALLQLGPRVLDALPPFGADASAEVQERLRRIRRKLQQGEADTAAQASLVTLHEPKVRLSKALAAIGQQTGNRIVDGRRDQEGSAADPELALDFEKTPFWSALDTVVDRAEVTVYPFGQADALTVTVRGPGELPRSGRAATSGPLRIEPVSVLARRELRSTAEPALMLALEVAWEPRLRPIGLKARLADVAAVDDWGQALAVEDPAVVTEAFPRRDAVATEMKIPFLYPPRPGKTIASLKGTLRAIVPGKIETFRFADLLGGKRAEQRSAAATVVLQQVRKNGDNWEFHIRLRFEDAGEALESHRNWYLMNEAYLEGPDGKPIPYDGSETTMRSKNEVGMSYLFNLAAPPTRLTFVYKTPGSIITKDFPYELKNIRLP